MQLIPSRLSSPCSTEVSWKPSRVAPMTTSLAGALWTPRVSSVRAHTPATWPDGGTMIGRLDSGSMTSIHGQYSAAIFES